MSQNIQYVSYTEDKQEHTKRVVEIYKNAYVEDQNAIIKAEDTDMKTQHTVSLEENKKVNRCYTLTVAWVILLCILFLVALAVLWITFSNMTTENNQLQISNNNLINQRDQQQISNNNLIKQRDQLQIYNNNLIKQKDQLEKENDGLKLTLIDAYATLGWSYFNSSFYYISTKWKTWNNSRQDCLRRGADLVIINNTNEAKFVVQQIKRYNGAWIGLHDDGSQTKERAWTWVDGTPLTLSYWNKGEPNNGDGNEHCVEIVGQQVPWNDIACSTYLLYICETSVF